VKYESAKGIFFLPDDHEVRKALIEIIDTDLVKVRPSDHITSGKRQTCKPAYDILTNSPSFFSPSLSLSCLICYVSLGSIGLTSLTPHVIDVKIQERDSSETKAFKESLAEIAKDADNISIYPRVHYQ